MVNLSSYQSYNILFNSLKQLPQLDTPGLSNIAGAFMAAKYGRSVNSALSSNLNSVVKGFRTDALELNKQAKTLSAQAGRTALKTGKNEAIGTTTQDFKKESRIKVDQLAAKQINQSNLLDGKQSSTLASGTRSLSINSGNKSYTVSVNVQDGESNGSVLNKTAKGINDLNGGFKARVATDTLGNQQLVIESDKTGKSSGFTIGGDLGTSLGLDNVTQTAEDAKFTYNDKEYTSESNNVTLDEGKTKLELKNTTSEAIELNRSPDTEGLQEKVTGLVSAYNRLQETLKDNPNSKALQAVGRQLDQLVGRSATQLDQFGITKDSKGKLNIDEAKLKQRIEDKPDQARDLFVENGSLADKLQKKTDQLLKAPADALIDIPKAAAPPSPYQIINSGLMNQMSTTRQNSGNLFDMFL